MRDVGGGSNGGAYPVQYSVDYPETSSRMKALFRIILVIPIGIVLASVSGAILTEVQWLNETLAPFFVGGYLFLGPLLMILFRQKYPRWWFDWNLALARFTARVTAFFLLLRDEYPSTDEEQAVHLTIEYPDVERGPEPVPTHHQVDLGDPHYIVLFVLGVMALIVTILAWVLILILGRYPQGMFDFVVGVNRWGTRVGAYMWLLTTDRYPPFGFSE